MSVGDRVAVGRRRLFVGRETEIASFDAWIRAAEPSAAVFFVHGPAGVGKSALLRRFADSCDDAGVRVVALDARDIPPVPDAVAGTVASLLAGRPTVDVVGDPARTVLMVDTYELFDGIDDWVRERFLPGLSANVHVVVAGQRPPSTAWRTDPGWADLVRTIPLGNLSADDCAVYLARRNVDASVVADVVAFTRGHPLALALVSEVHAAGGELAVGPTPDVIKDLIDRLVVAVPTTAHRRALEASAQVRVVTESLLAALLDTEDAAGLFDWMRGLPFVDSGTSGLHLHELIRDVLAAEVQWRDPERFVRLHEAARTHYLAALDRADAAGQAAALLDLMFLHSDLRRFLRAPAPGGAGPRVDRLEPTDGGPIRSAVAGHEGEESARIAEHWLAAQPGAWHVVRSEGGAPAGFLCALSLAEIDDDAVRFDPAVAAALRELAHRPPLRDGERATLFRYWMATDAYQDVSPVQSLIAVQLARHYLTTPGLALSLLPFAEPERWADFCRYADQQRMPAADFAVGGRTYAVFGHDWRSVPPAAWLAALARREIGARPPDPIPDVAPAVRVIGRDEFAGLVRRALRDLTRPDRLRDNRLVASRMVLARTRPDAPIRDRVTALQDALRSAASTLKQSPADERLFRVLHRAYLAPAPSLERAAEALGLPSSTFRRHLASAIERVVVRLWDEELGT